MYLETCWFGSPELRLETTQLPNPQRFLTHTELSSQEQGKRSAPGPTHGHPWLIAWLICVVWVLALHRLTAMAPDVEFRAAGDQWPRSIQHGDAQSAQCLHLQLMHGHGSHGPPVSQPRASQWAAPP